MVALEGDLIERFWMKIFIVFVVVLFLFPSIYLFGLDKLWEGKLLTLHKYMIISIFLLFFFYPFVKSWEKYREKKLGDSLAFAAIGIVVPVLSGLFGVFLFEVLKRNKAD